MFAFVSVYTCVHVRLKGVRKKDGECSVGVMKGCETPCIYSHCNILSCLSLSLSLEVRPALVNI